MASSQAAASSTTTNAEPALLSIVESLVSTYYPSAAISQLASQVLPGTVTIDSNTFTLHGSTSSTATSPSRTTSTTPTSHSTTSHRTTLKQTTRSSITSTPSSLVPSSSSTVTSQSTNSPHTNHSDETLAIILGSIFGALVLSLILLLLFCLWRRKRRHGSYFKGHDDTPQLSRRSTLTDWIPPTPPGLGNTTLISAGGGGHHNRDNHGRYTHSAAPPQMSHPRTNPIFLGRNWHRHDNGPNSESRPLVDDTTGIIGGGSGSGVSSNSHTPRHTQELTGDAIQPYELDHEETNRPGLFPPSNTIGNNMHNSDRAPTPYLPALLMPGHHGRSIQDPQSQEYYPSSQQQHQDQHQNQGYYQPQQQQHLNPFSSRHDHQNNNSNTNRGFFPSRYPSSRYEDDDEEEARDLISPIVPVKSADRLPRSSLVHYPSWDEVSEFDFEGENGHGHGHGRGGGVADRWSS